MKLRHWNVHLSATLAGALGLLLALGVATSATALPIEATVGSGANTANVLIEFGDDSVFVFEVLFNGTNISGIDALTTIETALASFTLDLIDYGPGFGFAVDGITYGAHSNSGFIPDDFYWHYFTKDAELDSWDFSLIGASSRLIGDGGWDGWKYNPLAPVPEPSTAVLVGIGLAGLGWLRRQRAV